MIVLIVITLILVSLLLIGIAIDSESLKDIGVVGLFIHALLGWLFLGSIIPTNHETCFYDKESPELRHFSYGSDVCFYIMGENENLTFIKETFVDNKIYLEGNWVLEVTEGFNCYSGKLTDECKLISKEDFKNVASKTEEKE